MLRFTLLLCATTLLVPCAGAQQQFISLHQFNKKLNLSYKIDGSANFIDNLSGIKNLYDPTGVIAGGAPACVLGVPQFSSKCSLVAGSIGGSIIGTYDIYTQYKFYFPAGSTSTGLFAAMPQSTQYATIARMGTPPTRTTPLTSGEYQNAKRSMDLNTDFSRLLTGQEVIMVHDGGGGINPTGNGRFETHPMLKGYWVYVRVLNNDYVTNLSGATGLDLDIYTDWYKGMIANNGFKSDGDPQDVISTPVRPTGIKLTTNAAVPGSIVGIQPLNSDAVIIGRCSIEPPTIAEQDIPAGKTLTGVTVFRYKVSVASNAVQGQYKVKCGDATDYSSQYAQYTPKFEAVLNVQDVLPPPVYTLKLSALSISLDDPKPVKVTRSDNGDVGNCTFSSSEQGFDPSPYVQWDTVKKEISLRSNAPALPGDKQISVTCSSSASPITFELKAKTAPAVFVPVLSDIDFKSASDNSELLITYKAKRYNFPGDFVCDANQYVDYMPSIKKFSSSGKLLSTELVEKIKLKSPAQTLPSSLAMVLSELTCSGKTSATAPPTSWTANFYLSNASGNIQLLPPSDQTKELTKELSADGSIRLKGVAPKADTDTGSLTVWFGVELKGGKKYALVWNDVSKKNEWAPGDPDLKAGTKVKHEGTGNEFSFDLAGITQVAIDADKKRNGTIKGTIHYQFGNGTVRQLNTTWVP